VKRTSVVSHYGVKTLMYGTLLPGPDIGRRGADILRATREAGFEDGDPLLGPRQVAGRRRHRRRYLDRRPDAGARTSVMPRFSATKRRGTARPAGR
jgi:hypothetical protein